MLSNKSSGSTHYCNKLKGDYLLIHSCLKTCPISLFPFNYICLNRKILKILVDCAFRSILICLHSPQIGLL